MAEGDEEVEEADGETAKPAKKPKARRPKVRYPRGELKERIGFLRRVRAIIGIAVVAVLLGICLAALIGGALVFFFLVGRSAITS